MTNPRVYSGARVYIRKGRTGGIPEGEKPPPVVEIGDAPVLTLALRREMFELVVLGQKFQETKPNTDYWRSRLKDKGWEYVQFRNGQGRKAPRVMVKVKRIYFDPNRKGGGLWILEWSEVVGTENWDAVPGE